MAIGAGLAAQFGIKTETTNGTAATVDHFTEINNETMHMVKNPVQGTGLRAGGLFHRTSRRVIGSWAAAGGVNFDAPFSGLGLLLEHMFGAYNPGTSGGTNNPLVVQQGATAAWLQTYAPGSLAGKTFTAQVGKPDATGTVRAFTYVGCKILDWQLSTEINQFAKFDVNIDGWQELTADNPQGTTAGPALATAVYATGQQFFHFREATIFKSGSLSTSGGITTLGSPVAAGRVTKASVKCENRVDTGRYFIAGTAGTGGSGVAGVKSEQLENDFRMITGQLDAEFFSLTDYYDVFAGDTTLSLLLTFTGPVAIAASNFPTLSVLVPNIKLNDGTPPVAGPGILQHTLPFEGLDDEASNVIQLQYMSTDTTP